MIHEFVEQGILSAEDKRSQGFGVKVELQQRVELGKDLDAHQVGFIDDQKGDEISFCGALEDLQEEILLAPSGGFSQLGDDEAQQTG